MIVECDYFEPHTHDWPSEYPLGHPDWKPSTYYYYDENLKHLFLTQVPLCDYEAIDYFTTVASWGPQWNPVYLTVVRPGTNEAETLKVRYNKETDEVFDL